MFQLQNSIWKDVDVLLTTSGKFSKLRKFDLYICHLPDPGPGVLRDELGVESIEQWFCGYMSGLFRIGLLHVHHNNLEVATYRGRLVCDDCSVLGLPNLDVLIGEERCIWTCCLSHFECPGFKLPGRTLDLASIRLNNDPLVLYYRTSCPLPSSNAVSIILPVPHLKTRSLVFSQKMSSMRCALQHPRTSLNTVWLFPLKPRAVDFNTFEKLSSLRQTPSFQSFALLEAVPLGRRFYSHNSCCSHPW